MSDGGRNGGRPRKEEFAPRAFAYNVEREDVNIMFLSGHRWDKPLASRKAGTLKLQDSDDALTFDAVISTEVQETSWARDFMAAFAAGLVLGLSPGFRLPPQRTVKNAETIKEEDPAEGNALIRVVNHALLWEVSAVTKAAYEEAQIEARNWTPDPATRLHKPTPAYRWRA
ncbi:HK97 family phage prohead protease [Marivita geojedonensis]|uniref:HK97 family phage prohead protease n=1 Tax=Marivita geojedonensis TaxID=1123756 RepID=UPI001E46766B|nr:HK97 family phage prohead protease [Marivita geojedonensis]